MEIVALDRRMKAGLKSNLLLSAGLATLLCILGCGTSTPHATNAPTLSEDALQDLAAYAEANGISVDEASRRYLLRQEMSGALAEIESDREMYAGSYFTDAGGWRLVVLYVDVADFAASRASINSSLPTGAPVEWRMVAYSGSQLDAITRELSGLVGAGNVHGVGQDTELNRVEVRVSEADEALSADLAQRFGDAVHVVVTGSPDPI